jgi:hypothetical protein
MMNIWTIRKSKNFNNKCIHKNKAIHRLGGFFVAGKVKHFALKMKIYFNRIFLILNTIDIVNITLKYFANPYLCHYF